MQIICSPGMRVVVYLPPNLVGLKISDCTVAIAGGDFSQCSWPGFQKVVLLAIGGTARHVDEAFKP